MTSTAGWPLSPLVALGPVEQEAVRRLAEAVERLDGAEPLNEQSLLRLSAVEPGLSHVVAAPSASGPDSAEATVGYAQVDLGSPETGATAEVLVGDVVDRAVLADALLGVAEELTRRHEVAVWSRGTSPVGPAAAQRGYFAARTLLTMCRSLSGVPADRIWPPRGVTVRTFEPGVDDEAWLAVNAAAFASHPEQGRWTAADLAERIAQPWFDPRDFFLAKNADGEILGYHWTKLHESTDGTAPIGEVYVLGIAPSAQGHGLGQVLLDIGLRHLKNGPATDVILYLEQDNASALRLYERDGFRIVRRDVQYRLPR